MYIYKMDLEYVQIIDKWPRARVRISGAALGLTNPTEPQLDLLKTQTHAPNIDKVSCLTTRSFLVALAVALAVALVVVTSLGEVVDSVVGVVDSVDTMILI